MLHVFLINVKAGKNNFNKIDNIIEEYCKSKDALYVIEYAYEKDDTRRLVEKYKNFDDVIMYSVGGDGTLNHTVNCIAGTNITLGIIPLGTGNDFYKSIVDYKGGKLDLGKVNDQYFINVASLGIDAEIANTANEYKEKNIKGSLVYILGILKNFLPYQSLKMNIDDINKLITIIAVCNGKFYGGGFPIAPNAILNDGLFDIYRVEELNKLKILKLIIELTKGNHIYNPNINFYRSDKLNVTSEFDLLCNIDGEIIKDNKFDFSIIKEAITIDDDELRIRQFLKSKGIIK